MFWFIPIIVALLSIGIGGYAFWMFLQAMNAIIQILSIFIVIILAPFLVKFLSDTILYSGLKISKSISLLLGIFGSVPILLILYINLWALIIFGMILCVIYFILRYYGITKLGKNIMSITKWFQSRRED